MLLLLSASPSICPVCTAELLLSFPLNDQPAHMETPVQAHPPLPYPVSAMPCACCHAHFLLPAGPASLPLPSPSAAANWQWDVRSPAEELAQLSPAMRDRAYGGSGAQRTGAPRTKQHLLALCLLGSWCRAPLDTRTLLGTLKHVLLSFPLDPLAPQVHPVLPCDRGCIAQLVLTPGVPSTHHSSAALSPKGTRAERSDGPSSAARLSPGGEQEVVSARG